MSAVGLLALVPALTRAQTNPAAIAMPGGDFESPVYGASPFYGYQPANSEWTWSGLAGVQRNGSGLGAAGAPAGAQTAFLQGSGTAGNQGAFSQNVMLAAGIYKVTFKAAQRATGAAVPIQIKMDGTAIGAPITPTNTSFATYSSQPFKVGAGNDNRPYRLGFSTNSVSGVSMSLIDSVVVEVAQPVASGGFEAPAYSSYGYQPANSGWTWSGQAGIQHNGSLGANAPEGVQTAFLQGASQAGAFSQNVTLNAGTYQVVFKAAQRSSSSFTPIQVRIDGNPIGSPITPSSPAFAPYSSNAFTVGAGNHTLGFNTTSVGGASYSLIDDVNIENTSSPTTLLPAPLAPSNPSGLAATARTGRVDLTWTGSSGANAYKVKRATLATGPYTILTPNVTATTYADTTVSNGTTYFYRVYAYNAGNISEDTNQATATPLAAPIVTAVAGVKRIDLTWNAVPGATGYRVFITQPQGAGEVPVNGTSASHANLNSGSSYSYNVMAYAANGSSDATPVSQITLPDAPLIGTSVNSSSSIHIYWGAVSSATSYRVKRGTSDTGTFTLLPNVVTTTSFDDNNLAAGTTYYYRVYAVNAGGNSPDSNQTYNTTTVPAPTSASVLTATSSPSTATEGLANLRWSAVNGATNYNLQRSEGTSGFIFVTNTINTSFADGTLKYGVNYHYRVYAYSSGGYAPSSNIVDVTVSQPTPTPTPTVAPTPTPTLGNNFIRQGGFEAPNLPASGYRYTNLVGSEWTFDSGSGLASNGSDFNNATAPEGVQVAFVQATGSIRQTVTFGAGTCALRFQAAARGGLTDDYSIKIDGITIDTLIQSNNPNSGYQQVTSKAFSVAAGTHEIQFIGVNSAGGDRTIFLDDVQTVTATPPPAPTNPTNLTATAGNTQIVLNWSASNGATSYKVKRSTTNGSSYTTLPATVNGVTYTDTGLTNGTTYYYRVYAVNATGNSGDSNQAQATPMAPVAPTVPSAPTGFTATAVGNQIKLSWSAVNGATGYKVFRSTTSGIYNYTAPLTTTTATTYDDNSVAAGTTYFYVVRAVNSSGESSNSAEGFAKVTVEPFTILNVSNGDILSGTVSVDVQVNNTQIKTLNLALFINEEEIGYFIPSSADDSVNSNVWSALVKTEVFSNNPSLALEVKDGLGHSQVRAVGIQNEISNVNYDEIFDVTPTATDVPHASRVTAAIATGSGWTAAIENDSQQIVRTFSGSGPTIDFSWDGRNSAGIEQLNGNYLISIKKAAPANFHNNPSGRYARQFSAPNKRNNCVGNYTAEKKDGCGIQLVQMSGSVPVELIVNMGCIVDTMILLDESAVGFGHDDNPVTTARTMLNYSKYIRTQISTRAFQFDYPANPIIVPLSITYATGFESPIHQRIQKQFSDKPLKLVYVESHGQDSFSSVLGAHCFRAGGIDYYAKHPGGQLTVRQVVVSELTYKWNYGELGNDNNTPMDPPKLVWISTCDSAGSLNGPLNEFDGKSVDGSPTLSTVYDPFPSQVGDITSWAECFGIDPARGYEGGFIGMSGFQKTFVENPNNSWRKVKYGFWYALFTEGRSVRGALYSAMTELPFSVERGYIGARYRFYGTPSTSF